ncbi:uncharacterized protein [Triticum aestivum]|uniref:uncharacterized protein n=1 Tax=Triticum aestivum TaxID=4565 RepID=UPI001D025ED5|nr:uncharacterized protein LOC123042046 [Triticum aestivum]
MERVDADTCVITIDEGRSIKFTAADVNNVFGFPIGGKRISSYPCDLSEACIEYKKFAEELSDKGTHSLKAVEAIMLKDIQEDSPSIAIEMFKIAAVIFIFGHLLCPSSKNDYTSVDYWGALNTTLEISQFDWCEFVIEHLLSAVRKLKTDLQTWHSTIHLVGCHLFLQVFVLDNLDLGQLTPRDPSTPRVCVFDYDITRKMIEALSCSQSGEPAFSISRVHHIHLSMSHQSVLWVLACRLQYMRMLA